MIKCMKLKVKNRIIKKVDNGCKNNFFISIFNLNKAIEQIKF